jgi:hypothetical protein
MKKKKEKIQGLLRVYFDLTTWISSKQQYFITSNIGLKGCKLTSKLIDILNLFALEPPEDHKLID